MLEITADHIAELADDDLGFDRLMCALEGGRTPIGVFGHLSGGRATDPIPGAKLGALVSAVAQRDGGYDAAFEILFMRLHSDHDQRRPDDPELAAAGRALLARLPLDHDDQDEGYKLRLVMKVALTGLEGATTARLIWQNLVAAIRSHETHAYEQRGLLKALFAMRKRRPVIAAATRASHERHREATLAGQRAADALSASDREALHRWYEEELQPQLANMTARKIVQGAAMGLTYAYSIIAGTQVPHPRHYPTLAALAGVELPGAFAATLSMSAVSGKSGRSGMGTRASA